MLIEESIVAAGEAGDSITSAFNNITLEGIDVPRQSNNPIFDENDDDGDHEKDPEHQHQGKNANHLFDFFFSPYCYLVLNQAFSYQRPCLQKN